MIRPATAALLIVFGLLGCDLVTIDAQLARLDHARSIADDAPRRWDRFDALEQHLATLPMTDAVRDRWLRLRRSEVALYPALNALAAKARIPLTFDNDHHRSARRWVQLVAAGRDLGSAVLQVDSHPDIGGLADPDGLSSALEQLRVAPADALALARIDDIVSDINHPMATAAFLGVPTIVWLKPPWAMVSGDHHIRLLLGRDSSSAVAREQCPAAGLCFYADIDETGRPGWDRVLAAASPAARTIISEALLPAPRRLAQSRPVDFVLLDPERNAAAEAVADALAGSTFLLSIDLDFFSTNGSAESPGNPCSSGRVDRHCVGVPSGEPERQAAFEAERRTIDARLRRFFTTMKVIADSGRRPACVSLADSTYLLDSPCQDCNGTGDFTPPDFVAYIRHELVRMLFAIWPELRDGWGRSPDA